MTTSRDLDRLDRGTLRAWRVTNLVGWWFAGAVIYYVGGTVIDGLLLAKIGHVNIGWQVRVAFALVSLFAAATAGWVVGRHVYRAPGTVGAATVLLPGILFIPLTSVLVFMVLPAALAIICARIAWRRRPSALRVGTRPR
jgi:hypothetical protein